MASVAKIVKRLRVMGTADDRQICAFDGEREGESLKRVKIIYEVADIAKGTEEYRFSAERRTCFDASARGGSTWYREARDSRRYRSPWLVSGTRVRAESRAHVD